MIGMMLLATVVSLSGMGDFHREGGNWEQVWRRDAHTLKLLPHWNWEGHEGEEVEVTVVSDYSAVELLLNGKSFGIQQCKDSGADATRLCHYRWRIPYAPGRLSARAYVNGRAKDAIDIETAGAPARLLLIPERDGDTLLYVQVYAADEKGVAHPLADHRVTFKVEGPGEIAAGDSARLVAGKAQVIVRRTGDGIIRLTATAPGLKGTSWEFGSPRLPERTEKSFTLASYNVRAAECCDFPPNFWVERVPRLVKVIKNRGFDLVGLQEAERCWCRRLEELLPGWKCVYAGRQADGEGESAAFMYDGTRFELIDHGTFWLSETPEVPGSKSWDTVCPRTCTWGLLCDRKTARRFYLFNTHLDCGPNSAQIGGMRLILERIREVRAKTGLPVFLTGDMNTSLKHKRQAPGPDHPLVMAAAVLKESWDRSETPHTGPGISWANFTWPIKPYTKSEGQIDHIFVSDDVRVLTSATWADYPEGLHASDHLAVSCDVELPSAAEWYPIRTDTVSLNGTWDFRLYESAKGSTNEVQINAGKIVVPGNWETQGFIRPRYSRHHQRDYAGVYTRTFEWRPEWQGRRVILRFDAVYFGFQLKINGRDFGLTTHAPNLHQFDITDALRTGLNTIEVKVLTSQIRDWLFDVNDCWTIAGITRDVEIFSVGENWISDIAFVPTVNADGSADLAVRTAVGASASATGRKVVPHPPQVTLFDAENHPVWQAEGAAVQTHLAQPRLWDVDHPYLYTLEVRYADQTIRQRVGIKSVKVDGYQVLVNNRPVFFKGAGLNEIDAQHGRAFTREDFLKRLRLMKDANINLIRTVHYPLAPVFYELCDELGFYVCDEIPISAQGNYGKYLEDDRLLPDLLQRAEATIRRDRNHPCVTLWSVGNENAYRPVLGKVLRYAKSCDPTRPYFFPMQTVQMLAFATNPIPEVDLYSAHYPKMSDLDQLLPRLDKPLLLTEFSHSNGEGCGNFEQTFDRMVREEKIVGGSIWCFQDQCLETDGRDAAEGKMSARNVPAEYQGVWVDARRFYDSHGILGSDGMVYGTMFPKEAYHLVKKLYGLGHVPSVKGERKSAAAPAAAGRLELCEAEPAIKLPNGERAAFVLKVGRPYGLLLRAQHLAIGYDPPPFFWDPHLLPAHLDKFERTAAGGVYSLSFYRNDDSSTNEVVRGTVAFTREGRDGFKVAYDLRPSPACDGVFLEGGFGFALSGDLARGDWDGFGPFPAVPGKSLMDEPGVWSLRSDDHRFAGNRMHVYWATLSAGNAALTLLMDDAMTGFERTAQGAAIFHDAVAVNYGTKLDWTPITQAPRACATPLRGVFGLQSAVPQSAADLVAERPFFRAYGR